MDGTAHQVDDRFRGFGFHRRDRVAVDVHRERDGRVTQPFTDDLRMNAGGESQSRECVPEVVKPDAREAAIAHVPVEHLREAVRVDGNAVIADRTRRRLRRPRPADRRPPPP